MTFELQVRPLPPEVAQAFGGTTAELRELDYGLVQAATKAGGARGSPSDGLLAGSLHVDGKPVGIDALYATPGRFARVIGRALVECIAMHDLPPAEGDEDDGPKE